MSRKHFSWLLFFTFLVAALVLIVPGKTGRESSMEQTVFLPGAAANINQVEWLRLTEKGGVTIATLKRDGSAWVVEEASGYRADWDRLKALLSDLSQANIIETKTSNPEYYPRLGVEDVNLPDAGGVMIEFSGDSNLPAVIIGNNARGREGQYARLRESAASALIDRRLDAPARRSDWLDKSIIDISEAEVVEVRIDHPDGESLKTLKFSADDENFALQDIPEGREITADWSVNALAGALSDLSLEAVAAQSDFEWTGASSYRLLTAEGLLLEVELLAIEAGEGDGLEEEAAEAEYWIKLRAGLYTTALKNGVEVKADNSSTDARAETINARVDGWAYRIPKYKFDSMTKRKDDLLKSAE